MKSDRAAASSLAVTTTVTEPRCSSGPRVTSLPCKPLCRLLGPDNAGVEKAKTIQQQASSSFSLHATDAGPLVSAKVAAKSRRARKIGGQPSEMGNPALQSAGEKDGKTPAAAVRLPSSLPAVCRMRCAESVSSQSSGTKAATSSSKVVAHPPNGLVAAAGKPCRHVADTCQTGTAAQHHGHLTKPTPPQLLNGLHVRSNRSPAKTDLFAQNGGSRPAASKLETHATDRPTSGLASKTSGKTAVVASEERGRVKASKSPETCGQSSSLTDIRLEVNEQVTTGAAAGKGKKARRKGRGKEASTSVG